MDFLTLLVYKWLWFKLFTINFNDYLIFSHGQLYVALSRGVSQNSTKAFSKEWKIEGEDVDFTKNVIFKNILLSQS